MVGVIQLDPTCHHFRHPPSPAHLPNNSPSSHSSPITHSSNPLLPSPCFPLKSSSIIVSIFLFWSKKITCSMEGWVRGQWVKVFCPKVIPSHSQCSILKLGVWTAIHQNFLKKGSPLTEFWAVKCLMRLGFHKVVFRHIDNIPTMTFSGDFISHLGIKASQIFQLDWARTEQTDLGFCLRLWLGLWLYFTLTSGLFITS